MAEQIGTPTPGPWSLGFADEKVAFVNSGPIVVCKCDRGGDEGQRLASPRANSRLIAATPDLLAATERALSSLRQIRRNLQEPADDRQRAAVRLLDSVIDDCDAAVFKAKGRS